MKSSYISYYDYYKPSDKLTMSEILDKINITQKNKNYILKYSNLDEIAVELKYNQFEMYHGIMEKYFAYHDAEEIRYLIFTGEGYFTDNDMSLPYYLVGKYGLKNASIIALNQGCAGTPEAIHIADCIIKSEPNAKVMIVSLSKKSSLEDRYDWPSLTGDGAALMVLGSEGFLKILGCNSWSDGYDCVERYRNWSGGSANVEGCSKDQKNENQDIIVLEQYMMPDIKRVIMDLLECNKLSVHDVHKLIPQNLHHLLYRIYSKSLNIDLGKFFLDNIPYGGHLGDVDSIRNLKDCVTKYNQNPGSKYLLFTIGDLGENSSYNAVLMESC